MGVSATSDTNFISHESKINYKERPGMIVSNSVGDYLLGRRTAQGGRPFVLGKHLG